ncbi:MAG: protein PhaF [Bacteroidetes bacterium]|jgi:poly(hydroxyalkanoate) granule-associated protein|nr:protein PhaF [Bacteroidota bacterium]
MAKKKDKKETKAKGRGSLPDELTERGREVWLAGLGAMAAAEEEGTKLFNSLIEKGKSYESQGRKQVEAVAEKATEQQEALSERVQSTIAETVEVALERFGVPTQAEVKTLSQQVDRLTKKVERLTQAMDDQPA